jgi:hypothetical protein
MQAISCTHTEETDYIVAQFFLLGYLNTLTTPLVISLLLLAFINYDFYTNIYVPTEMDSVFSAF